MSWVHDESRKVISWRIWRMRVCWGGGRAERERVRLESRTRRRPSSPYIALDGDWSLSALRWWWRVGFERRELARAAAFDRTNKKTTITI
jgi:hypothetical protein